MKRILVLLNCILFIALAASSAFAAWSTDALYNPYITLTDYLHSRNFSPDVNALRYYTVRSHSSIVLYQRTVTMTCHTDQPNDADRDAYNDPQYYEDSLEYSWEIEGSTGSEKTFVWHVPAEGGTYTLHWKVRDKGRPHYYYCGSYPEYCYNENADDYKKISSGEWDQEGTVEIVVFAAMISQANDIPCDGTTPYCNGYACIPENDNDDNENDVLDSIESGFADPTLKPITFTGIGESGSGAYIVSPPNPIVGTVAKLWSSQSKESEITPGTGYPVSGGGTTTCWLEGILSGDSYEPRILGIDFNYGDIAGGIYDTTHFTIYPAAILFEIPPFTDWSVDDNKDTAEYGHDIIYPKVGSILQKGQICWPSLGHSITWDGLGYSEPISICVEYGADKIKINGSSFTQGVDYAIDPTDFVIEGVETSDTPGDVVIRASVPLPGPAGYMLVDKARMTIADVDLSIDERTEINEETDPRPIAVNDDDDNENGVCDYDVTESPLQGTGLVNDDDLVEMHMHILPTELMGMWWIEAPSYPTMAYWDNPWKDSDIEWLGFDGINDKKFYIEAYNAGYTTSSTLKFTPGNYQAGPYHDVNANYTMQDTGNFSTIDPEIDFEGTVDHNEVYPGGFVPLNHDDDDGVVGIDNEYTGVLADEDMELRRIDIHLDLPGNFDLADSEGFEISVSGSNKVKFWTDGKKSSQINLSTPKMFYFESGHGIYSLQHHNLYNIYLTSMYVEGCTVSGGARDVEMKIKYIHKGIAFEDKLKMTVVNVVIDSPGTDSAVLISTNPDVEDDPITRYHSPSQSEDRKIKIIARVEPVISDCPVYLSVIDPPDESPYIVNPGYDDNADPSNGLLEAVVGYTSVYGGKNLLVYTNQQGYIEAKLSITDHCSGDNYIVSATPLLQSNFSEPDETGKLIAWKRVYLEVDSMYKVGSDLTSNFTPNSNQLIPDQIFLDDTSWCSIDDEILIFDSNHEGETAVITYVDNNSIEVDRKLVNHYSMGYPGGGASVAKPSAGHYTLDLGALEDAYGGDIYGHDGGCFVEFVETKNGANNVPYKYVLGDTSDPDIGAYSLLWFKNRSEPNCLQLIASRYCEDAYDKIYGMTFPAYNAECVYIPTIKNKYSDLAISNVTAHETGHQFELLATDSGDGTYCHNSTTNYCVMSYNRVRDNGISEFCYDNDNHLHGVRNTSDPR